MKFTIALVSFFLFCSNSFAVAFLCLNDQISVEIDQYSEPLNEQFTMIEKHTYLYSVDYGQGNLIESALESIVVFNIDDTNVEQNFDNGMILIGNKDRIEECDGFPLGFKGNSEAEEKLLCCQAH